MTGPTQPETPALAAATAMFVEVLVIGIGGSALGPQFVSHALGHPRKDKLAVSFFDNTDPDGFEYVLSGLRRQLAKTLVVVIRKAGSGQVPYIQWKFHNVQVASFAQNFSSEARPVDTMTFKYAKAEMIYFKQNQDGSVESAGRSAAWDADLNKSMATTLPYKPTKK